MLRRVLSFLIGLVLLAGIVYPGFRARDEQTFVIWFGIASAILAPAGIASVAYSFRSYDQAILRDLAKVPEIEKLVQQAKSQEEKVRLLEDERERLLATVQLEARKETLSNERRRLEEEGRRILLALKAVEVELGAVSEQIEASPAAAAIEELREKLHAVERGDMVIRVGSRYVSIDRDLILSLPFGRLVWWQMRMMKDLLAGKRRSA